MRAITELISLVPPELLGFGLGGSFLYFAGRLAYRAYLTGCTVWLINKALNRGVFAEGGTPEFTFRIRPNDAPTPLTAIRHPSISVSRSIPTPLGEALRRLRVEHHLTLADIAVVLSATASEISEIESGTIDISEEQLNVVLKSYKLTNLEEKRIRELATNAKKTANAAR